MRAAEVFYQIGFKTVLNTVREIRLGFIILGIIFDYNLAVRHFINEFPVARINVWQTGAMIFRLRFPDSMVSNAKKYYSFVSFRY